MKLRVLEDTFSVCKLFSPQDADWGNPFCFAACTDEEVSCVCPVGKAPARTLAREDGWRGFRIEGVLDFSLVGILARVSAILAENGIAIFAVSTYNTDYVFLKEHDFDRAIQALLRQGYEVQ